VPDAAQADRRVAAPSASGRGRRRLGWIGEQPGGAQRGARLLDGRGGRAQAEPGDEGGSRGLERGRGVVGPGEERDRVGVADERSVVERDHAVRGSQAALEAMFGEQDRRPPLLVEAPQEREQLIARDRVQLRGRLVEHEQARASGQRRAERDALELAA